MSNTPHIVPMALLAHSSNRELLDEVVRLRHALDDRADEYTDHNEYAQVRGEGSSLGISKSNYSGFEPNLVSACYDAYSIKPSVRTIDHRRYIRIPCRNVQALIKTEHFADVIVNLLNISRGGACFTSFVEFCPRTPVSIATHYIEGGQNIFQNGRIIRMQRIPFGEFPGEYAVEFCHDNKGVAFQRYD